MRYQDVIDNLRQFYMGRIVTQQRIPEATIADARYPDHIVEHAQGLMVEELAKKLENAYQHGLQAGRQLTERLMRSSTYGAKD